MDELGLEKLSLLLHVALKGLLTLKPVATGCHFCDARGEGVAALGLCSDVGSELGSLLVGEGAYAFQLSPELVERGAFRLRLLIYKLPDARIDACAGELLQNVGLVACRALKETGELALRKDCCAAELFVAQSNDSFYLAFGPLLYQLARSQVLQSVLYGLQIACGFLSCPFHIPKSLVELAVCLKIQFCETFACGSPHQLTVVRYGQLAVFAHSIALAAALHLLHAGRLAEQGETDAVEDGCLARTCRPRDEEYRLVTEGIAAEINRGVRDGCEVVQY